LWPSFDHFRIKKLIKRSKQTPLRVTDEVTKKPSNVIFIRNDILRWERPKCISPPRKAYIRSKFENLSYYNVFENAHFIEWFQNGLLASISSVRKGIIGMVDEFWRQNVLVTVELFWWQICLWEMPSIQNWQFCHKIKKSLFIYVTKIMMSPTSLKMLQSLCGLKIGYVNRNKCDLNILRVVNKCITNIIIIMVST